MKLSARNLILMVLMIAASGMAVALKPTKRIADQGSHIDLQTVIPKTFGNWHEELVSSSQIVDPQQKQALEKIYSQILSRTYVDLRGYRVMLSIAYGANQSDSMQMHYPDICYPAQGFSVSNKVKDSTKTSFGNIAVYRLQTSLGRRIEPVTYWTIIGNKIVRGGIEKKIAEIGYGVSGNIPDGMLIRVSSIDEDSAGAFSQQDQFITQMLASLSAEGRYRLIGDLRSE